MKTTMNRTQLLTFAKPFFLLFFFVVLSSFDAAALDEGLKSRIDAAKEASSNYEYEKADKLFKDALKQAENSKLWGYELDKLLEAYGLNFVRQKKYAEAEPLYRRMVAMRGEYRGQNHVSIVGGLAHWSDVLAKAGKKGEAEQRLKDAIKLGESIGPKAESATGIASEILAKLYVEDGRLKESTPLFEVAIKAWDDMRGSNNVNSANLLIEYAQVLSELGKDQQAKELRKRAQAIREHINAEKYKR